MARKILDGMFAGAGFIIVVALAFAIAWAGDVFTVDKDGTLKFAVSDAGKITVGATESYVNLVIQNNSGAATNKVDITADVLTVDGIRLESVNVSADITAAGAGGRDAGSEAANMWYYVFVIANNDGTSWNGLLSTSSTSPTMPSGFTKKRRVGTVRNDGSSNFLQFVQEGSKVRYSAPGGTNDILVAGQATSFTAISAAAFVPPTSRAVALAWNMTLGHNAVSVFWAQTRKPSAAAITSHLQMLSSPINNLLTEASYMEQILDDSRQLEYYISAVPSAGGGVYINVLGYFDRM
ncbi:MAG: hypothetical protein A2Z34_11540 [Planctomycetes bacterium RBG_16_59_8]|nr:MAG: hypothetical protein A2Z34_11540 [Planctomycetes bacterium RBG_16_59_8]